MISTASNLEILPNDALLDKALDNIHKRNPCDYVFVSNGLLDDASVSHNSREPTETLTAMEKRPQADIAIQPASQANDTLAESQGANRYSPLCLMLFNTSS